MAIITLCGSTRFPEAFQLMETHLALLGHVVLTVAAYGHSDIPSGIKHIVADGAADNDVKQQLDELHFKKIAMCDSIVVINFGNYVGESLQREIAYARSLNKGIFYMFPLSRNFLG